MNYLQNSQVLIHLHIQPNDDENERLTLPSNILIVPIKKSFSCFCYENLIE